MNLCLFKIKWVLYLKGEDFRYIFKKENLHRIRLSKFYGL